MTQEHGVNRTMSKLTQSELESLFEQSDNITEIKKDGHNIADNTIVFEASFGSIRTTQLKKAGFKILAIYDLNDGIHLEVKKE